jgi:hypothetical protein
MAINYSTLVRNAELDAIETAINTEGADPILTIFSGTKPADCATANAGTVLVTVALPTDYFNAAAAGSMTKLGTWEDTAADATGTAGYFRIHDGSSGANCHIQGTVTITSGGGDMELDNTSIATGQQVTITTFTITAGNS